MDRILLLGEGNFSFTKSLCMILQEGAAHITTSSYDSQEDVIEKYPEAKSIFAFLQSKSDNVVIKHGVDALEDFAAQLQQINAKFEYIIFNFPHIGKENCHLHKSFLGHLLHRVGAALVPNGLFYLTLAEGQAENWGLADMAARQQFQLIKTFSFDPSDFPLYQMKRHQVGKSFKQRITSHQTFVLAAKVTECADASFLSSLKPDIFNVMKATGTTSQCESRSSSVDDSGGITDKANNYNAKPVKEKQVKKRKMVDMTAGRYEQLAAACFRCRSCEKDFSSEQGARTHVYVEHVLERGVAKYQVKALEEANSLITADATAGAVVLGGRETKEKVVYRCSFCGDLGDKTYASLDALYQHVTAKHHPTADAGAGPPAAPATITKTAPGSSSTAAPAAVGEVQAVSPNRALVADEPSAAVLCDICGVLVTSISEHLAALKPPEIQCWECSTCARTFQSERGIEQHSRFCRIEGL